MVIPIRKPCHPGENHAKPSRFRSSPIHKLRNVSRILVLVSKTVVLWKDRSQNGLGLGLIIIYYWSWCWSCSFGLGFSSLSLILLVLLPTLFAKRLTNDVHKYIVRPMSQLIYIAYRYLLIFSVIGGQLAPVEWCHVGYVGNTSAVLGLVLGLGLNILVLFSSLAKLRSHVLQ